jgi:transcriptional regulator with XRE-family HTH domain
MEIKVLMIKNRLTNKKLAELMNMKACSLSSKLNNNREWTMDEIKKLLKIFNKTFEEIFLDDESTK